LPLVFSGPDNAIKTQPDLTQSWRHTKKVNSKYF